MIRLNFALHRLANLSRAEFQRYWQKRKAERKSLFVRSKVDAIPIRIDRPYIKPIVDFFQLRERRL